MRVIGISRKKSRQDNDGQTQKNLNEGMVLLTMYFPENCLRSTDPQRIYKIIPKIQ